MTGHPHADGAPLRDEFTAWLTASCNQQGVPLVIRDPGVVAQVVTLLGANTEKHKRRLSEHQPTVQVPGAAHQAPSPRVVDPGSLGGGTHIDRPREKRAA